MTKKLIVSSLLVIVATTLLSTALSTAYAADRKGPPGGGKPPVEAFTACSDKSAGDSCSFSGQRGDVTGTCKTPPQDDKAELACAPEGGRPAQ